MAATPDPVSVADSETVTGDVYAAVEQTEPLHAIEEAGAVVSAATSRMARTYVPVELLGASQARNALKIEGLTE
jgi:hypothetical protein